VHSRARAAQLAEEAIVALGVGVAGVSTAVVLLATAPGEPTAEVGLTVEGGAATAIARGRF
jgi:hypothetical protein